MSSCRLYAYVLACISALVMPLSVFALEAEHIVDGTFELGTLNVDIQRYPRYPRKERESGPRIITSESTKKPCLFLPAQPEGGYRFTYAPFELHSTQRYQFQSVLRTTNKTTVTIEVRAGSRRIEQKSWSATNSVLDMAFAFDAVGEQGNEVSAHTIRIWIRPQGDACLELISLRGPAIGEHSKALAALLPGRPTGVYGLGEAAHMRASISAGLRQPAYRITDPVAGIVVESNALSQMAGGGADIPLPTTRRGFFRVDLLDGATGDIHAQRGYVVIRRGADNATRSRRYGVAMEEEHSQDTMVYARSVPEDVYRLAADIGAGSLRIFALASPEKLSSDGVRFDFYELDGAIDLADKYDLEVMLELGVNDLRSIPAWMRLDSPGDGAIDLRKGLRIKRQREAFSFAAAEGVYLSMAQYRLYLERLFGHLSGRVSLFEIWNEPGHKLRPEDYIRIAELTRNIQKASIPDARLLGPTSSAVQENGRGRAPAVLPGFVFDVMKAGRMNIDILSYHSAHVFPFMGDEFDRRNQETGFVQRLRRVLHDVGSGELPVWDTERGVPWKSYHADRIDMWKGRQGPDAWIGAADYLEPTRRLAGIFSAAWAAGVERLFWFNVDPSTSTIARTDVRWGMFDADMEPMPHIAAFDAYTETVGAGVFQNLIDKPDGTRCYVFRRGQETVLVVFNWKDEAGAIHISSPGTHMEIRDVMGNIVAEGEGQYALAAGMWAQYAVIGAAPDNITIE